MDSVRAVGEVKDGESLLALPPRKEHRKLQ